MIEVEGYLSFKGIMRIKPKSVFFHDYEIEGEWVYKPEHDCWYDGKSSYPASICEIVKDYTENV